MDVLIRPALAHDMAEVARVFRTSFSQAMPWIPTLHTPQEDIGYFEGLFARSSIFVADQGRRVVGFIAFDRDMVSQLYLLPEAQRQGIGSRLLVIAQERSPSLRLWAFQKNTPALRFYEKQGFREVRRTDGADNEEKEPDVLLAWQRPR
jgi:putative acetyltransferase